MRWLMEIKREGVTFESLQSSGPDFLNLDIKISAGSSKHTAHGELGLMIQNKEIALLAKGMMIKGRQILFFIQEKFKSDAERGSILNITHLGAVKFSVDAEAGLFKGKWDKVLLQINRQPHEEDKFILFRDELEKSKMMAGDII